MAPPSFVPAPQYQPLSTDAMFSRVIERLDAQDRKLEEILQQGKSQDRRITDLEREKWMQRGAVAAISAAVAAFWSWLTRSPGT